MCQKVFPRLKHTIAKSIYFDLNEELNFKAQ